MTAGGQRAKPATNNINATNNASELRIAGIIPPVRFRRFPDTGKHQRQVHDPAGIRAGEEEASITRSQYTDDVDHNGLQGWRVAGSQPQAAPTAAAKPL